MLQRYLNPAVLSSISGLDLIAKTVVDGFVAGLHRSPDFGFSQEFAEYRPYTPGDDLRYVDWNVFARTERTYLKRYHGETNTQLTVLLDTSGSMSYASQKVDKLEYAKYLAASLVYLAHHQRDAAGLIVFDETVRNYVPPSGRQGQLSRLLHGIGGAQPGTRTNFSEPFLHFQNLLHRRGLVAVLSDFYDDPETIVSTMQPLTYRGSELMLFHILDPQEIEPDFREPKLLVDMESEDSMEVAPDYARHEYRAKINAHITALKEKSTGCGMDYFLLRTDRPLDDALREYLMIRQGRM